MKKLNIIYHVVVIGMIGYLGIANYLLVNKVKEVQQEARVGMMMSTDANIKIEMFMQMMSDNHKDEIRAVLQDILEEKAKQ